MIHSYSKLNPPSGHHPLSRSWQYFWSVTRYAHCQWFYIFTFHCLPRREERYLPTRCSGDDLNIPFLKSSKLHFFLTLIFTENSFAPCLPVTVNLYALFRIQECVFVFTGRLEALIFVRILSKKASMLFICNINVYVLLSFICHPYLFPSRTAQAGNQQPRERKR